MKGFQSNEFITLYYSKYYAINGKYKRVNTEINV